MDTSFIISIIPTGIFYNFIILQKYVIAKVENDKIYIIANLDIFLSTCHWSELFRTESPGWEGGEKRLNYTCYFI